MRCPIHVAMVAVHTVGAGGNSIARSATSGLIQVRRGKRRCCPRADLLRRRRRQPSPTLRRWCFQKLYEDRVPIAYDNIREDGKFWEKRIWQVIEYPRENESSLPV